MFVCLYYSGTYYILFSYLLVVRDVYNQNRKPLQIFGSSLIKTCGIYQEQGEFINALASVYFDKCYNYYRKIRGKQNTV